MAKTFFTVLALSLSLLSSAATVAGSPSSRHNSVVRRHRDIHVERASNDTNDALHDILESEDDEEHVHRTKRGPAFRFDYGGGKVRGVNLGGWLVLEPWITPSLFDQTGNDGIVDEYTFCQYQNYEAAHAGLVNHWDTWITEGDFWDIKNAGLNHVRIPIGYWAYDVSAGEPYHQGQDAYLRKAVQWAGNAGLKVWIDLHGVPGSQNGFDNSGVRISYPTWHTKNSYLARSNAIIKSLSTEYSQSKYPQVAAIAPLNEPAGYRGQDVLAVTRQYWYDSYGNIRFPFGTSQQGDMVEVIHDAFQPLSYWTNFARYPSFEGVAIDTHIYEVFSDTENARSYDQHINNICSRGSDIQSFSNSDGGLWTVVGEWSTAATDCAKYLNGRGIGARYDGSFSGSPWIGDCGAVTGDGSKFSGDYKTFLRKFWEAQVVSFEKGQGWIYWTWKAEIADEWSYSAGLKYGWIPSNPDERMYPGICG